MVERDAFLEVPAGERRRQVTAELQDANSRTRLLQLDVDEATLRDFDQPVTAHIVFAIGDHFTGETDKEGSVADSKVWGKFLAYNLDYDRKTAAGVLRAVRVAPPLHRPRAAAVHPGRPAGRRRRSARRGASSRGR